MNKVTFKDISEYCKSFGYAVTKIHGNNSLYVKVQEWANAQHSKYYSKEAHTVCKFTIKATNGIGPYGEPFGVRPDITMDELKTLVDEGMKWRAKRDNKKLAKVIEAL